MRVQGGEWIHPNPDKQYVMKMCRYYLLGIKRKFGTARGLGHYHGLLQTYLIAKREWVEGGGRIY